MAERTYSDICRDVALKLDGTNFYEVIDENGAAHLRSLADLLDTTGTACVGTKEADEAMERLISPLSDS
jgi:hypothetical protein